ncbi:MAG: hypothetical protein QM719_08760 [Thermomonas sp.]
MKKPSTRSVAALASVALLATLIAHAARMDARGMAAEDASADLLPNAKAARLAAPVAARVRAGNPAAAPSQGDVGDVDSFGRSLVWLGVTQGNLDLSSSCPPDDGDPTTNCVVLNAAPAATAFTLNDIGHVTLPGKSANSLLCYWFSPILSVDYLNPGAASDTGMLAYSPTLTVESEVLNDPALIDPTTGLPFDGKLVTGMTSSEHFEVPLAPGQQQFERSRDSTVCIAGLLSKQALVGTYGLTDDLAKKVFKKPITIRLNVNGSVRLVDEASLMFGLRIVGD